MLITTCIPCQYGVHEDHQRVVQACPPGVMGGAECRCEGECRDNPQPKSPSVRAAIEMLATTYREGPMANGIEFDRFFEQGDHADGEEPQAFADWLAGKTGKRVVGLSEEGAVQGEPRDDDLQDGEDGEEADRG